MKPQPVPDDQAPSGQEPASAVHNGDHGPLREKNETRHLFAGMTPPELIEYALLLLEDTERLRRTLDEATGTIR